MKQKTGIILIVLGVVLALGALGLVLYNRWDSDRAGRESQQVLSELKTVLRENPVEAPVWTERPAQATPAPGAEQEPEPGQTSAPGQTAADPAVPVGEQLPEAEDDTPEMPAVQIEQWSYIGLLEIPSLNLELPVLSKWDYNRLRVSPCRFYGSVYRHNLVICGHNYQTHFSPVRSIEEGAEVLFTDMSGTCYHYVVSRTETLQPTQVSEMIQTDESWDLTLFTCNPGGTTRFAVRCKETEETNS